MNRHWNRLIVTAASLAGLWCGGALAEQGNNGLQLIDFLGRYAHLIVLHLGFHLQLGVFDGFHDFAAGILVHTGTHLNGFLNQVAAGLLIG